MALKRRSSSQFSANIWPGFVDAMTALLLVLMFVLTIFMIVQFVLRDTITGQDAELDELSIEIQGLASALGLERRKSTSLENNVATLNSSLTAREQEIKQGQSLLDALTFKSDTQASKISKFELKVSDFEAQVAGLLSQNTEMSVSLRQNRSKIAVLTGESANLKARNQRLTANLAGQSSQNATLSAQNKRLTNNLSDQQAQNQKLAADAAGRVDENARLTAQNQELAAQNQKITADAQGQVDENSKLAEQNQLLLADKDALARANLQVISESEALQLALVQARDEIDESVEAARLAAIKREFMESILSDLQNEASSSETSLASALTALAASQEDLASSRSELANTQQVVSGSNEELARLRQDLAASQASIAARDLSEAALRERIEKLAGSMSAEKRARLAEAVAAAALKARLKGAQDELTAMTLSLEKQRQAAEDTLTLLAAAELAERDALGQVQVELSDRQKKAALLATANARLSQEKAMSAEGRRKVTLLNQQTVELRKQLDALQGLLDQSKSRDVASKVQIESLGTNLNAALAQVAADQKKLAKEQTARADLEEKERIRLEAETTDLKKFRSEFFGRLRDVLGTQQGVRIVGDRFVFSSEILFGAGSADLGTRGKEEIRKVASVILDVADQIPDGIDWILRVDGHTDKTRVSGLGKYKDNWELSQGRALSVVKYLIDDLGIPASRLAANGFGEFQPIEEGDSPEALAINRRIELKFTEK